MAETPYLTSVVIILPTDRIAPWGARASAGIVMVMPKFWTRIDMEPTLKELINLTFIFKLLTIMTLLWRHMGVTASIRQFVQEMVILTTEKTLKIRITDPLWGESTVDQGIPLTKGHYCAERSPKMRSSSCMEEAVCHTVYHEPSRPH